MGALMLSSTKIFMNIASFFLQTPVNIGSLRLNLATFMTALCCVLSLLSYASYQSQESRLRMALESGGGFFHAEAYKNVFYASRNMYVSLLGLSLWATAWRLDTLFRLQILKVPEAAKGSSVARRVGFGVLALLFLIAADVPLCRVNYNFQLAMFVTPKKTELLKKVGPCSAAYLQSEPEGSQCWEFCEDALKVSQDRQWFIHWARGWHTMGKVAAQLFDDTRGVQQDEERIAGLFKSKPCARVLESVDKSNALVNYACLAGAIFTTLGFLWAASEAFFGDGQVKVPPPIQKLHTN